MKTKLFILLLTTVILCACNKYAYLAKIPTATDTSAIRLQNIVHLIDSSTAHEWTDRYQMYKDSIRYNSVNTFGNILATSESFNKQYLLKLLALPNCIGINIAYGMDINYKVHDIIYGVDANFHPMYIHDTTMNAIKKMMVQKHSLQAAPSASGQGAYALETGQMCPTYCPR